MYIYIYIYIPITVDILPYLVKGSFQNQPPVVFSKKGVLKNFEKLTGKHLRQSFFFNKVAGLRQPLQCIPITSRRVSSRETVICIFRWN